MSHKIFKLKETGNSSIFGFDSTVFCEIIILILVGGRNRHIVTQDNSAYSHPPFTQSLSISTNTVDSTANPTEPLVNNVMYAEILL